RPPEPNETLRLEPRMNKKTVGALVAVALVVALGAWRFTAKQAPADPAGTGMAAPSASAASGAGAPAVSVTTVRADKRDYEVQLDATGTVTALNSVDVKPQVSSIINKVHIREGQFVKAGDVLFTLDARTDEAN